MTMTEIFEGFRSADNHTRFVTFCQARELGSETFRPPEVLRRMVSEGKLGKKTGQGFYDWSKENEDLRRAQSS